MTLKERFEQFEGEYLQYKGTGRLDLIAFNLLNKLVPGDNNIVCSSEHDEIYLETDIEKLNEVATDDDIRDLVQCGVMYDKEIDSLLMFT